MSHWECLAMTVCAAALVVFWLIEPLLSETGRAL